MRGSNLDNCIAKASNTCSPVAIREIRRKQKCQGVHGQANSCDQRLICNWSFWKCRGLFFLLIFAPFLSYLHTHLYYHPSLSPTHSLTFLLNLRITQAMTDDQLEEPSRIQCAIRRLSSVFKKREIPVPNIGTRLRSIKRDSAPSKSALKSRRRATVSNEVRVSFADLLPHVDVGPPFSPFDTEPTECRGRSMLRTADRYAHLRRSGDNRKRSHTDPTALESAARHDSSVEQIQPPNRATAGSPRDSIRDPNERHDSLDRSRVMEGNSTDLRNRLWPRPLFADMPAGDRFSWPALGGNFDAQESAASRLSYLNWERQNFGSPVDDMAYASATYQAHVDRSLQSARRNDRRRSTYLRDSLVQMQEGLSSTRAEIGDNDSCFDEASLVRDQAIPGQSNIEQQGASAEKKSIAPSSNTASPELTNVNPSVPPAAPLSVSPDTIESEVITNPNSSSGVGPAQTESPPPVPPRHPDRRLIHLINDLRSNVSADFAEEKESARDSGISM